MKTIFVSSTFKDMHYERDAIQESVLPLVNGVARKYGQSVSFCDLRWGINTDELESEEGSKKVLEVCLDEIDRCQPPMVVILGERYGWIPSNGLIADAASHKKMQIDSLQKSVTALEIEYGALRDPQRTDRTLFYFREIVNDAPDAYRMEDEEHAALLNELKQRIVRLTGGRIKTYQVSWNGQGFSGMDGFAHMLAEDLENMLLPEWESYDRMTPYEKERYTHWNFIREKSAMFLARQDLADSCMERILGSKYLTIIKGASGVGKSTLFSYLAVELEKRGFEVLPFVSSLTSESNTAMDILQGTVYDLELRLGLSHYQDEKDDILENNAKGSNAGGQKGWCARLNELCTEYITTGRRLVIMLDAADQLFPDDARDKLLFIPDELSDNVRFVMTCLPDLPLGGRASVEIDPVREKDKRGIIGGILTTHNRELSEKVIEEILKKPSSDNPLYLSLLVQRLVMMNKQDFDQIVSAGDGMDAITQHQIEIVAGSPDSLTEMSAELLQVAGQRINETLVLWTARYIALSRHGMRAEDLAGLLEGDFNNLDFAHFISYMSDSFILRDDGRYDFSHKSIRDGFRAICPLPDIRHFRMYDYFARLDDQDPVKQQETGYHCILSRDKEIFKSYVNLCTEKKQNTMLRHTAQALYETSLQDQGRWLLELLDGSGDRAEDYSLVQLIVDWYESLFQGNAAEQDLLFRVRKSNMALAERVCQVSDTERTRRSLAIAYRHCAISYSDLRTDEGRQTALELKQKNLAIMKRLLEAESTELNRRNLSISYTSLGNSYENLDMKPQALAAYREALALDEIRLEEQKDVRSKRSLASDYDDIGDIYQGDFFPMRDEEKAWDMNQQIIETQRRKRYALELYQKALALREEIVAEQPTALNRRNLSYSYRAIAKFNLNLGGDGTREKALQMYLKEVELLKTCAAEERTMESYRRLAISCESAGERYEDRGTKKDLLTAFDLYKRARDLRNQISLALGTSASQWALMQANLMMARAMYKYGGEKNLETAFGSCGKIRKMMEDRPEEEKKSHRLDLYQAYVLLGDIAKARGGEVYTAMANVLYKEAQEYSRVAENQAYAYAELLEILDMMEEAEVRKVSAAMMDIFRTHALPNYKKHLRVDIPLENQDLSKKTTALIAMLSVYYWCNSDDERQSLVETFEENERKYQEEQKKKKEQGT